MAAGLGVDVTRTDDRTLMCVAGEVDLATAPELDRHLNDLVDQGVRWVTLDVTNMEFIDSTGLGVIVSGMQRLRQQGGDLVVCSPNRITRRVLEISGLDQVLVVVDADPVQPVP